MAKMNQQHIPNITVERCSVDGTCYELIRPEHEGQDYLEYSDSGVVVKLDVHEFAPNEIICKVSKNLLEVIAENDRAGRCGIFRKYVMPQNIDPQRCICEINKDGMLYIALPWETNILSL